MSTRLLVFALLLCPSSTEAFTAHRTFVGGMPPGGLDMQTITLTGTVVSTVSLSAMAHDGVLVAEWSCSGSSECGEERDRTAMALYDRGVLAIMLTVDPGGPEPLRERHVGGTLAWVGEASVRVADR